MKVSGLSKIEKILEMQPRVLEESNKLSQSLLNEVGEKKILQEEVDNMFINPNAYIETPTDPFIFSASALSHLLTITLKDLYTKNNLPVNEEDLAYLDDINKVNNFPNPDLLDFYGSGERSDFEDLSLAVPIEILKAIETQLQPTLNFDIRHSNSSLEKDLKKHFSKISHYANFGIQASEVLKECNFIRDYGAVNAVMKSLRDKNNLFNLLKDDQIASVHDMVIGLHAQLRKVPYFGDSHAFSDSRGNEIDTIMHLSKQIFNYASMFSDVALSDSEDLITQVGKYTAWLSEGDGLRRDLKKDWFETIYANLTADVGMMQRVCLTQYPFSNLSRQLTTLGIPPYFSRKFKEYLSFDLANREFASGKGKSQINFSKKGAFSVKNPNFPETIHKHLSNVTGQEIIPFSQKFFDGEKSRNLAEHIRTINYVANIEGGKINSILEEDSLFTTEFEIERMDKQYPYDDIYIAENYGVCLMLDLLPLWDLANPRTGFTESRDLFGGKVDKNSLKYKLGNLQVALHEGVHVSQINSPLARRCFAANIDNILCDLAIKSLQTEKLDSFYPSQELYRLMDLHPQRKLKSIRDVILEIHHSFTRQLLGEGAIADNLRKYGITNGLLKNLEGVRQLYDEDEIDLESTGLYFDGELNVTTLKKLVPLEKSRASTISKQVERAISKGGLKELLEAEELTRDYMNETNGMIETQAQAFSLEALSQYIRNSNHQGLQSPNLIRNLHDGEYLRGYFAKTYIDIVNKTSSVNERDELLMENGIKYQRVIEKGRDIEGLSLRLGDMGIHQRNPFEVRKDIRKLQQLAKHNSVPLKELLYPMNAAYAMVGLRYDANLPLFTRYIEKVGSKKAFKDIVNAESFNDLKTD